MTTRNITQLTPEELEEYRALHATSNELWTKCEEWAKDNNVWLGNWDECKITMSDCPHWYRWRDAGYAIAVWEREHNLYQRSKFRR